MGSARGGGTVAVVATTFEANCFDFLFIDVGIVQTEPLLMQLEHALPSSGKKHLTFRSLRVEQAVATL